MKDEDKDGALFAANFNHFEKKGGRHRKVMKKVDDEYFIKLEKREKEEAARRSLEQKRLKNNEMLKLRMEEIASESEKLKVKFSGDREAYEAAMTEKEAVKKVEKERYEAEKSRIR